MTVLASEVKTIQEGARVAHRRDLHRLGGLLTACGELADEMYQGQFADRSAHHEIIYGNLFQYATKVSTDLINGEARDEAATVES